MSINNHYIVKHVVITAAMLFLTLSGAGSVFADHCKGKHRNDPGCDGGGGEDPSANPALAWVSDSYYSVNVIDVDGSNNRSIFNRKAARSITPRVVRWSPVTDQVLYQDRFDRSLYIVDMDGSNLRPIAANSSGVPVSVEYAMEWRLVSAPLNGSPERIFFLANPVDDSNSRLTDLYVMDPHSGSVGDAIMINIPNTTDHIFEIAVSPDGLSVIVIYYEDDYFTEDAQLWRYDLGVIDNELYLASATVLNIDSPAAPSIQFNPWYLKWANRNPWVLFTYDNDLYVLDLTTLDTTLLIGKGAPVDIGCPRSATWSPDDSMIAFDIQCYGNQPKNEGIYIVDFNPGDLVSGQPPYVSNVRQLTTGLGWVNLDWRKTWTAAP